jgi:hypothetical protein
LATAIAAAGPALAAETTKKAKDINLGALRTATSVEARELAANWLKSVGKTDEATTKAFNTIWADEDAQVLGKVAQTLSLGSEDAKKILTEANNAKASAPTEVPAIIKDTKVNPFLRANLALAYAKALSDRRVYEESLESLKAVKVEQVVDPAQYLFIKAVAEHALIMKTEATDSIGRLLEDVSDSPERYSTCAALMIIDMMTWKDKDLGWIERKMGNIERRLDLSRGGKKTQEIERQVVARLDEIIKEMESGGGC